MDCQTRPKFPKSSEGSSDRRRRCHFGGTEVGRRRRRLSQAQIDHMEELLAEVLTKEREKKKKTGKRVLITSLEFDSHTKTGLKGRLDWPVETYDRFVNWCRDEYEVAAEVREGNEPNHI